MADVTLSNGREITFDLYQMTINEWERLLEPDQPRAEERATLAKVSGLTVEEIGALPYPDYHRLTNAFVARCRDPLADAPD